MKDPACLFYINDWLTSTAEMDADCRGWYLNMLLHNYDKGDLPHDIEKLAVLCNVKFSEYSRFEHVFKQVIEQKFEVLENGRLSNLRTQTILRGREQFKEKRVNAGKTSYLMRFFYKNYKKEAKNQKLISFIKEHLDVEIDTKNEQVIEHMFKQVFELYRNENEIKDNIDNTLNNKGEKLKFGEFENVLLTETEYIKSQDKYGEDLAAMIEKLSSYIKSKGDKYKDHYATFSSWVYKSVLEDKQKNGSNSNSGQKQTPSIQRPAGKQSHFFTGAEFSAKVQERIKA